MCAAGCLAHVVTCNSKGLQHRNDTNLPYISGQLWAKSAVVHSQPDQPWRSWYHPTSAAAVKLRTVGSHSVGKKTLDPRVLLALVQTLYMITRQS